MSHELWVMQIDLYIRFDAEELMCTSGSVTECLQTYVDGKTRESTEFDYPWPRMSTLLLNFNISMMLRLDLFKAVGEVSQLTHFVYLA